MLNQDAPFDGLDDSGRRRLWLLQVLIQQTTPEEALKLAERMEEFVLGVERRLPSEAGAPQPTTHRGKEEGERATVVRDTSLREVSLREAPNPAPVAEASGSAAQRRGSRLLQGERMREFMAALGAGADNTELARRFGLTPRQANGLRMGIQKQHPHLRLVRPAKPKTPEIDRPTELQMQEEFLRQKPVATTTLDDVVRFLRQRGDVVVRADDHFLVNGRSPMTASELVARANEKRMQLRQPAFVADVWNVSPVANAAAANGVGDRGAPRTHDVPSSAVSHAVG